MRFLLDEMYPPSTCTFLTELGHDAVHVRHRGLDGAPDPEVAALARAESRALVTENVRDLAREREIVIACVLKARLPAKGMAARLATVLDIWAEQDSEPYAGMHWPQTEQD